jgi:hypothetical protein
MLLSHKISNINHFKEIKDTNDSERGGAYPENNFWMELVEKKEPQMTVVQLRKRKLRKVLILCNILAFMSILVSQMEYEFNYFPNCYFTMDGIDITTNDCTDYQGLGYRIFYTITSILLTVLNIIIRYNHFSLIIEQRRTGLLSFFNLIFFCKFFMEFLINIIHPFPGLEYAFQMKTVGYTINYQLQTFFYCFNLLKFYHFNRAIVVIMFFRKHQFSTSNIDEDHGNLSDTTFGLKCMLRETPFIVIVYFLAKTVFVCGIMLRMFEMINTDGQGHIDFYYFTNGWWCIIVSITTVGYGDFYPKTNIGRCIVIISVFLGTFFISLTIVALQKSSSLDKNEMRAFTIVKKMNIRKQLREVFIKIIQTKYRMYKIRMYSDCKQLICDNNYTKLKRKIDALGMWKITYQRILEKDMWISEEDKFLDIEPLVESNIVNLKMNLKLISDFKKRFTFQLEEQKRFIKKLDDSIINTKNTLREIIQKKQFNKKIKKNTNHLLISENDINSSKLTPSILNTQQHKYLKQPSTNIFKNDLGFFSLFDNKINQEVFPPDISKIPSNEIKMHHNENLFNSENKGSEYQEPKDEYLFNDTKSKQIVQSKSSRTMELMLNLEKLKYKNNSLLNKQEKIPRKMAHSNSTNSPIRHFNNPKLKKSKESFNNQNDTISGNPDNSVGNLLSQNQNQSKNYHNKHPNSMYNKFGKVKITKKKTSIKKKEKILEEDISFNHSEDEEFPEEEMNFQTVNHLRNKNKVNDKVKEESQKGSQSARTEKRRKI